MEEEPRFASPTGVSSHPDEFSGTIRGPPSSNRRERIRVATGVATLAAFGVTQRYPADFKRGRNEPKRPLAAHTEPSAIAVRDREAPGSNPGPPTIFVQNRRFRRLSGVGGSQFPESFEGRDGRG